MYTNNVGQADHTVFLAGPLTNVALAMKLDPEFGGRLKELFIMGGNFGEMVFLVMRKWHFNS